MHPVSGARLESELRGVTPSDQVLKWYTVEELERMERMETAEENPQKPPAMPNVIRGYHRPDAGIRVG